MARRNGHEILPLVTLNRDTFGSQRTHGRSEKTRNSSMLMSKGSVSGGKSSTSTQQQDFHPAGNHRAGSWVDMSDPAHHWQAIPRGSSKTPRSAKTRFACSKSMRARHKKDWSPRNPLSLMIHLHITSKPTHLPPHAEDCGSQNT
jgi:hypothetical protein